MVIFVVWEFRVIVKSRCLALDFSCFLFRFVMVQIEHLYEPLNIHIFFNDVLATFIIIL